MGEGTLTYQARQARAVVDRQASRIVYWYSLRTESLFTKTKKIKTTSPISFYLPRTQFHLGHVDNAKLGLEGVLRARRIFSGSKHPDTLMAMAELGAVCHSLGQTAKAEKLLPEVLKFRIEVMGEEHAYTLWTINDLSKVYTHSGHATNALKMMELMIPVVVRPLENRHIGMNMTKYNPARTYNALGRWTDGEKVLQSLIRHLSYSHPDYTVAIIELARGYQNMKRFEEAEVSYLKPTTRRGSSAHTTSGATTGGDIHGNGTIG